MSRRTRRTAAGLGLYAALVLLAARPGWASDDFSFAVIGDYGTGGYSEYRVARLVESLDVDFILTTGDNNYSGFTCDAYDRKVGRFFGDFLPAGNRARCIDFSWRIPVDDHRRRCDGGDAGLFDPLCAPCTADPAVRFYPTPGNHDTVELTRFNGMELYSAYFPWARQQCAATRCDGPAIIDEVAPALAGRFSCADASTPAYYDVVIGDVHFFLLDSNCNDGSEPDVNAECVVTPLSCKDPDAYAGMSQCRKNQCVQRLWLEQAASRSTSRFQIVLTHHPPYTSFQIHGSCGSMQADFDAMGIDAVISGHAHIYERIVSSGLGDTRYFVNGTGGGTAYETCIDRHPNTLDAIPGAVESTVYLDSTCEVPALGVQYGRVENGELTLEYVAVDDDAATAADRCRFDGNGAVECASGPAAGLCRVSGGKPSRTGEACR